MFVLRQGTAAKSVKLLTGGFTRQSAIGKQEQQHRHHELLLLHQEPWGDLQLLTDDEHGECTYACPANCSCQAARILHCPDATGFLKIDAEQSVMTDVIT